MVGGVSGMKGTICITRPSLYDGRKVIAFEIKEESSNLLVAIFTMTAEDFAESVTGLAYRPIDFDYITSTENAERFGMKRETKTVFIDRVPYELKDHRKIAYVRDHLIMDGYIDIDNSWEIFSDGLRSQQNGEKHKVVLVRWIPNEQ